VSLLVNDDSVLIQTLYSPRGFAVSSYPARVNPLEAEKTTAESW